MKFRFKHLAVAAVIAVGATSTTVHAQTTPPAPSPLPIILQIQLGEALLGTPTQVTAQLQALFASNPALAPAIAAQARILAPPGFAGVVDSAALLSGVQPPATPTGTPGVPDAPGAPTAADAEQAQETEPAAGPQQSRNTRPAVQPGPPPVLPAGPTGQAAEDDDGPSVDAQIAADEAEDAAVVVTPPVVVTP